MNTFWIINALLIITSLRLYASDIPLQQLQTTAVRFQSTTGQTNTIDIADSDSLGIVYRKVARAFGWDSHPVIYCCGNTQCLPLALDITDIFFENLEELSPDDRPVIVTSDSKLLSSLSKQKKERASIHRTPAYSKTQSNNTYANFLRELFLNAILVYPLTLPK